MRTRADPASSRCLEPVTVPAAPRNVSEGIAASYPTPSGLAAPGLVSVSVACAIVYDRQSAGKLDLADFSNSDYRFASFHTCEEAASGSLCEVIQRWKIQT